MNFPPKPASYQQHLGELQILEADAEGTTPIAWAWPLTAYLEATDFETLRSLHPMAHDGCQWLVVAKQLTPEEIAQACGPVTSIRLGPNQGFLSITFGQTTFNAASLTEYALHMVDVRPDLASNKPRRLTKTGQPTARPPARATGLRRHKKGPGKRRR